MYVAEIVLPNLSFLTTVILSAVPVNSGSGVNVTLPFASITYVPSPSTTLVVVPSSNVGGTSKSTSPVNSGVLDCGVFLAPSDVLSTVFVTGVTVGVYLAVTSVPFVSWRWTVTPVAVPKNSGSGVNVTLPLLGSIVYVPSPSTVTESTGSPVLGSTSFAGEFLSISTVTFLPLISAEPPSNSGVPVWTWPLGPVDVLSSPVGVTGTTVGVYLAVTGVPFSSTRCTSTPSPLPVNCGSGVNTTIPFSTVYVPSPGITTGSSVGSPVSGSINWGALVSSILTVFSTLLTVTLPPTNSGKPVCFTPWTSLDLAGVAVGVTPLTLGV